METYALTIVNTMLHHVVVVSSVGAADSVGTAAEQLSVCVAGRVLYGLI